MNPNQSFYNYKSSDLQELDQKIHHRFIRDVVKPYSNSIKKPHFLPKAKPHYRIPRSSELYTNNNNINKTPIEIIDNLSRENYNISPNPSKILTPSPVPVPVIPNCMDVNIHVNQCPVCSKLYQPYNCVLMIIIVILILIILFMAKFCWSCKNQ